MAQPDEETVTFGKPLTEPILGANYSLPPHALYKEKPIQDYSMRIISVFQHLKMYHVEAIEIPTLEQCLIDAKNKWRDSKWVHETTFYVVHSCQ